MARIDWHIFLRRAGVGLALSCAAGVAMSLLALAIGGRTNVLVFLLVSAAMFSVFLPNAVIDGAIFAAVVQRPDAASPDHGRRAVFRTTLQFGMAVGAGVGATLFFIGWAIPDGTSRKGCLVGGLFLTLQTLMLVSFASTSSKAFAKAVRDESKSPPPD